MLRRDEKGKTVVVRDLTKRFGSFTAVDGISFSVSRGEVFGFLGPNGAGKSTTIRMLCGLLKPTSGSASVLGHDAARHARRLRAEIGYMSQKFSLYEDLTVMENIRLFAGLYGLSGQRFSERGDWALWTAGLREQAGAQTRTLSAGHKQRLALACSLIHEPGVLFLDEPTSGVDPVTRKKFWNLIEELSGRGVTILVTTHYMDEASHCDRLAMIYRGRLIALDFPANLAANNFSGEILQIEASPLVKAQTLLEETPVCRECALFGSSIHAFVDSAPTAAPLLREALDGGGVRVLSIEPASPSLEDIFISLIEKENRKEGAA